MRKVQFETTSLVTLFRREKTATMAQLKKALGTKVDLTVFRKLKALSYRTSYSHRGKYYTLDKIARFNREGLCSFRSAWFSRFGTLLSTAEVFVVQSERGYFASELENVLHVGVKDALRKLALRKRIVRKKLAGKYLYCSPDSAVREQQMLSREGSQTEAPLASLSLEAAVLPEFKAAIVLFFSLLNEKQRRLYAGLESLKWGHGGDRKIADFLGLDVATVAKGRQEIFDPELSMQRLRKPGAGRRVLEKKRPKSSKPSKH